MTTEQRRKLEAKLRKRAAERETPATETPGWRQREAGAKSAKSAWRRDK